MCVHVCNAYLQSRVIANKKREKKNTALSRVAFSRARGKHVTGMGVALPFLLAAAAPPQTMLSLKTARAAGSQRGG